MGETWNLSTADTEVEVGIAGERPIIRRLAGTGTKHNWSGEGMAVPLMGRVWVGQKEAQTAWAFVRGTRDEAAGTVTLAFANAEPKLALRSIWRARPSRGPVEHWMEIENLSGQRVTLGHQDSLSLRGLRPGGAAALWWIKRGGSNASTQGGTLSQPLDPKLNLTLASNCEDGASPVPWLAVQVGETEGLYVGWEFSGLGRIHARAANAAGAFDLDVGNHPDFKTDIEPGETFLVPPAFVGCYAGDLDEGSHSLHRFIVEKLRPAPPKDCPDPILAYNLYIDVGGDKAKEADVLRSARFCREIGFEAFMPDAMWFPHVGDWRWDPARFPNGVKPIEEYVHAAGMRLALWCAWTNGGLSSDPGALNARSHPDWFREDYPADWRPGAFVGGKLCLACQEARDWAKRKTQWLVAHHKLDYVKHDIDPITTRCSRASHRHRHGTDASYWAAMGYYEVQEALLKAFPGLILENCSGGGHIKDFGVIQRTHYTVTTDTLSNLPNRQSIWDSTWAFPPLLLQAYTYDNFYRVPGDEPGTFLWRSAMMGAWQIDPTDTPKWSDEEKESARRSAEIYKDWVRPILRDVKVHHILPRPDGKRWDGMFYWSTSLKKGTLYIFRPESDEGSQTVRLKGLDAQAQYSLWSEDGSLAPTTRPGDDLMQKGLTLSLPEPYTSDLVFIQDASLGKPKLPPPRKARPAEPDLAALKGVTFATEIPWVRATAGANNPIRKNRNYYGRAVAIAGKRLPKALWTHSFNDATPADIVFDVAGKGFVQFKAEVGLDDMSGGGSVLFQVLADGKLIAQSPVLRPRTAHSLQTDIAGAKEVILRVLNGGDDFTCDHAAWGLPRFIHAGAKDPLGTL